MSKPKRGRHAPAFILLTIALEPNHGLGILNKMNELVPQNRLDTAVIYRVLKTMESDGDIESQWQESDMGPKKKVYNITDKGMITLNEFCKDIEKTIGHLNTFVEVFNGLK